MEFNEKITQFSERIKRIKDNICTEEATKTSIILPFLQILGYDVFNPLEFVPEFTADTGIKKGEKVDYAILNNGDPLILIEAKSANTELTLKHMNQLLRYFIGIIALQIELKDRTHNFRSFLVYFQLIFILL